MRAIKSTPIFALTFALFAASGSAAAHSHNACAVPRGWALVAQDRYAVVIRQRGEQQPAYKYCARRSNRFAPVASSLLGERWSVVAVRLSGRYIGYETQATTGPSYALWLSDVQTGARSYTYTVDPTLPPAPEFALSPNGVAAWIVDSAAAAPDAPDPAPMLQVLTASMIGATTLDSSPPDSAPVLANLQLYDCATGCAPNTVIVAWTHNGQQRFAPISSQLGHASPVK
jgi:hypothetical protein